MRSFQLLAMPLVASSVLAQSFPCDFVWGTATAAYQVEGAYNVDGRGFTIWDTFVRQDGKIVNGDTGDEACQQYFLYEQDIQLMKDMNVQSYRFSLAWARILPEGVGEVNQVGIDYYNNLIDALIANDIVPFVTLYHWDMPQALEDSYGGWLGAQVQDDFAEYARIAFEAFGDRVTNWITLNEPQVFSVVAYGDGAHAPGRCSDHDRCGAGDSAVEPYIVSHNALLAHAKAVQIYREEFQADQAGQIGITIDGEWNEPLTDSTEDILAAERRQQFQHGWFFDPVFFGDYPDVMKLQAGDRLPEFTSEEKDLLRGSSDFAGINHYTSRYISNGEEPEVSNSVRDDYWTIDHTEKDGVDIGVQAASTWLWDVPRGIRGVINWVADRYDNPPIYITENGRDHIYDDEEPLVTTLNDQERVDYFAGYLENVRLAIEDGANVKGYFAWSLLDNFEWANGYQNRFGLHYVNFTSPNKERIPRASSVFVGDYIVESQTGCEVDEVVDTEAPEEEVAEEVSEEVVDEAEDCEVDEECDDMTTGRRGRRSPPNRRNRAPQSGRNQNANRNRAPQNGRNQNAGNQNANRRN